VGSEGERDRSLVQIRVRTAKDNRPAVVPMPLATWPPQEHLPFFRSVGILLTVATTGTSPEDRRTLRRLRGLVAQAGVGFPPCPTPLHPPRTGRRPRASRSRGDGHEPTGRAVETLFVTESVTKSVLIGRASWRPRPTRPPRPRAQTQRDPPCQGHVGASCHRWAMLHSVAPCAERCTFCNTP
jgi:hypothetical protein